MKEGIIVSLRGGADRNNATLSFSELPPEADKLLRMIHEMGCWAKFERQGNVVELRRKCGNEHPVPLPWSSLEKAILYLLQAHRNEHPFPVDTILVNLPEAHAFTAQNNLRIVTDRSKETVRHVQVPR